MSSGATARNERTRAELLGAARWVLLERGVGGFSLREVARRAGFSPAAIYNHFADKDALVAAVAMECVGTLAHYLGTVQPGPAPARLVELGLAYAAFADDNPAEYAVIFDCLSNPPHSWEQYVAVAHPFAVIVSTCEQGLSEGSLRDRSQTGASGMAYAMWCLVDGNVHLRAKHLAAIDAPYADMFGAALTTLVRGFANDEGAAE